MADNLCGPSAPTKGLVGHLNGDRTLQQDRVVNAPGVASGTVFRSTENPANVAAGDAAFAAFTATQPQPQALATHHSQAMRENRHVLPDGRVVRINQDGRTFRETHPALLGMGLPGLTVREGFDGPAQANTSWVQDFERMQLDQRARPAALGNPAVFPHQVNAPYLPSVNGVSSSPNFGYMNHGGQMMMSTNVGPLGPSHIGPVNAPGFQVTQQAGASSQTFGHYPQAVALAANTEEALNAAFALYDNDFQEEMDQWVAQHGPEDREDHDAIMEVLADDLDERRRSGDPRVLAQNAADNRAKAKALEDHELRKHATRILAVMADGNDKFKNSSFNDLMRRIVNREVVVEGNEIIDVTTGEPADITAREPNDQPLTTEVSSFEDGQGKGKGKEKEAAPAQQQNE
ncbi:hypothetical protein VP1G_00840 [Cytospora mali]|uniref:Peroxin 20 n=1 Tax=Cytospora mali TaxID=578113 RepID=A0A194UPG9_CYTMA|nr:hypothetical protein VP1G_00840 [Valsa mali var. pyri (nom. inval.)]